MSFPTACSVCIGRCCTRYSIEVTAHDLQRISSAQGLPAATICGTVPSWEGRCPIEPSRIRGDLVNVVISQSDTGCRFYRGGHDGNCGIYPVRPRSCAVYPFFGGDGIVLQRENLPCPAPWSAQRHAPTVADDIDIMMAEISTHNQLVRDINTRVDDTAELTTYVNLLIDALAAHNHAHHGGTTPTS
ncbi:YkgJ family cysteine cluster protein [Nocardia amamiensis]|uniref:YkgJ family cysteine cluster protein n=1 Tax=Nocardia amamiensis TaxID=404578 RepID=A0ABS0D2G5_9NOCA|nr:YkgJ family cysteine cluster protein [Nocardia amamiensis]MBF6303009.1 YkgJ family cysteine cluster protein [Nocardia amamiensis]